MRRDLDVFSLVAGLFFLGVAAIWGFGGSVVDEDMRWQVPLLLVAIGVVGLVTALPRRRSRSED